MSRGGSRPPQAGSPSHGQSDAGTYRASLRAPAAATPSAAGSALCRLGLCASPEVKSGVVLLQDPRVPPGASVRRRAQQSLAPDRHSPANGRRRTMRTPPVPPAACGLDLSRGDTPETVACLQAAAHCHCRCPRSLWWWGPQPLPAFSRRRDPPLAHRARAPRYGPASATAHEHKVPCRRAAIDRGRAGDIGSLRPPPVVLPHAMGPVTPVTAERMGQDASSPSCPESLSVVGPATFDRTKPGEHGPRTLFVLLGHAPPDLQTERLCTAPSTPEYSTVLGQVKLRMGDF